MRDRKRRVLLVFCSMELGGAERQGMYLAEYLKEHGYDVHIWSTLRRGGGGTVAELCDALDIPWEEHRFLWPCRKSSLARDGIKFVLALRRLRPDAIVAYTTSPNVACGLFWKLSGAEVCVWGQRNIHELRGDLIERAAYRNVSHVVCNAEHEQEYLRERLGSTSAPVTVIYNGVKLPPPQLSREEWRAKLAIPTDAVVAVMVANFRKQKDHATLLRAWKGVVAQYGGSVKPHLILAGAEQNTYESTVRLAQELQLDTVHFAGQARDVSGLLQACDIGVLLSENEGLSNSVIEYMLAGLPVVATDNAGNREALGDDARELVNDGDEQAVVSGFKSLIEKPKLRDELGERNRERAAELFSVEKMCRMMSRIIGEGA